MVDNKLNILMIVGIFLVLIVPSVIASGVSSSYWEGEFPGDPNAKPLIMYPGETKAFTFSIQNANDVGSDERYSVSIASGNEVVSIADAEPIYDVRAGSLGVPVNFKAVIPSSDPIGKVYKVRIEFNGAVASESGQFQFGSGIVKKFDIIVQDKSVEEISQESGKESSNNLLTILIVGILIIVLVLFLVKGKRKRK